MCIHKSKVRELDHKIRRIAVGGDRWCICNEKLWEIVDSVQPPGLKYQKVLHVQRYVFRFDNLILGTRVYNEKIRKKTPVCNL